MQAFGRYPPCLNLGHLTSPWHPWRTESWLIESQNFHDITDAGRGSYPRLVQAQLMNSLLVYSYVLLEKAASVLCSLFPNYDLSELVPKFRESLSRNLESTFAKGRQSAGSQARPRQ